MVRLPAGAYGYSLLHSVHTRSAAQPLPLLYGCQRLFPREGIKWLWPEASAFLHLVPRTPLPQYALMACKWKLLLLLCRSPIGVSVWLLGYEMDYGIPDTGKTSRISGSIPLLRVYLFTRKVACSLLCMHTCYIIRTTWLLKSRHYDSCCNGSGSFAMFIMPVMAQVFLQT